MDERKVAIIIGVALILMVIMGFLLMPRGGSRSGLTSDSQTSTSGLKRDADNKNSNSSSSSGSYVNGQPDSGGAAVVKAPASRVTGMGATTESNVTGATKQAFTEEEMQEFRNNRDQIRAQIYEKKKAWLQDKAKDPGLSAKSQVRYRLKLIEGFRGGNEALNKGDYAEAISQYLAGAKDPDACPVTRYVCFDQMRYAARMMKDHDLYLEILKEQAKLIESEDLAVLGIEKSKAGYEIYNRRKLFVQASKSPEGLQQAIRDYMEEFDLKDSSREKAEKEFTADFEEWKKTFDMPG